MRALVLCLAITATRISYAQSPQDLVLGDAPLYVPVDGAEVTQGTEKFFVGRGLYLNEAATKETAKIIVSLQERTKQLESIVEQQEKKILPTWLLVTAGVVAFGIGAGAAVALKK